MRLSLNWLNEFIDLSDHTPKQLAELLTMKTCEVEGIESFFGYLENFPVALVREVSRHPDAGKLSICQVDTGSEIIQIVTGAPNVMAGKKYPLAPVGSTLPDGTPIKKAKLRGVDSWGMLCSIKELQLVNFQFGGDVDVEAGLFTLPDEFVVGKSLRSQFNLHDIILDIDNKSITHRPDLWSHFGFARELSALLNRPLKKNIYDTELPTAQHQETFSVEIRDGAAVYCGLLIKGIKNKISPLWLQARLLAAGMRPVNLLVDISNYVMLECGQPNHAFDRALLTTGIVVDRSRAEEKLQLLDGRDITLPEGIIVIRDGKTPVALAGVMGGASTEVSTETTTVFLESATFFRPDIRKTIAITGIRSEASQRFEKGQTPALAVVAIARYVEILRQLDPAIACGPLVKEEKEALKENLIHTSVEYLRSRLGMPQLSHERIGDIFTSLGMQVSFEKDNLTVKIPHYRSYYDVTIPEDLVEELGRVIGYREIQPVPFLVPCEVPQYQNHLRRLEHRLRDLMAERYHYTEVYNYAFCSAGDVAADTRYAAQAVEIANPIQADLQYLRVSPLPPLLRNIASLYKEYNELRFFEIERIFLPKGDELPEERVFLSGIELTRAKPEEALTGMLSMGRDLLIRLGIAPLDLRQSQLQEMIFHPGRAVLLSAGEKPLLRLGQIHPRLADSYGLLSPVYYFETFVAELLPDFLERKGRYIPPARFPASDFEITVLADRLTPFAKIAAVVGEVKPTATDEDRTVIEEISHVSTYEGPQVGEGKKAVSLRVVWRNRARTLTGDEIKDLQNRLVHKMTRAGFALRS